MERTGIRGLWRVTAPQRRLIRQALLAIAADKRQPWSRQRMAAEMAERIKGAK